MDTQIIKELIMETKKKPAYQMPTIEIVEIAPFNAILEGSNENIGGGDLKSVNPGMFSSPLDENFPLDIFSL